MATGFLGTNCVQLIGNTGVSVCPYNPKNIVGIMLVPAGTTWTPTQVTAWQATVAAGVAHITETSRYFPISVFEDIEDKGSDAETTTTGYGVTKYIRNGKYAWRFMYSNGAMDLHAELSRFNGQQDRYDVLLMDGVNNGFLCTASGQNNVKGFSLDTLYAPNIKVNTGGADTIYAIEVGLQDSDEMNLNWRLISVPRTIPITTNSSFLGLKPTRLEVVTELVASTKTIVVRVWSGATNLYDYYATELVTLDCWDIVRNATGISTIASSVTATPATKSFTVVSSTMATSAANDEITVNLGTVAQLSAAGITRQANASAQSVAT